MADDERPGGLPPTLADVARRAGVSRQTVSNAINNPTLLRSATLARVQDAIEELGYLPNRAARNLRTGTTRLVGLRYTAAPEQSANTAMDRFVHALVAEARRSDYHVLLVADAPDETGALDPITGYDDLLRSTSVDAFVVTETHLERPQTAWLTERRAPFVAFGRPWGEPDARHSWVDVDGAAGVRAATEHLLERGHRRIAWLGFGEGNRISDDRRSGWQQAMAAAGLDTAGLAAGCPDLLEAGIAAARALLPDAPDAPGAADAPDAVVCASDTLALAVLHVLAERGLRPGYDVSVVGFDDSTAAQVVPPGLTTVRAPLAQAAVEVVAALQRVLGAQPGESAGTEPTGVLLTPELIVRGSTVP